MGVTQVALIPGSVRETDSGPVPSVIGACTGFLQTAVSGRVCGAGRSVS